MNFFTASILSLMITIVATGGVLVSAFSGIRKWSVNRKRSADARVHFVWEVPVVLLSLYTAMIGTFLSEFAGQTQDALDSMHNAIVESLEHPPLNYYANPSESYAASLMSDAVQEAWGDFGNGSDVLWLRTIFFPSPSFGSKDTDDKVLFGPFHMTEMQVLYLIGIPSVSSTRPEARETMIKFLFYYLTDPDWKLSDRQKNRLRILPANGERTFNTWFVEGPRGTSAAAELFEPAPVDPITPMKRGIIISGITRLIQMIRDDFEYLRSAASIHLAEQVQLEYVEREPYMIFYDATWPNTLLPMTTEDLRIEWADMLARWEHDSGGKPLPLALRKLETNISAVEQRRRLEQ